MYNISKKRMSMLFIMPQRLTNICEMKKEGENNIFLVLPVKHKNLMALLLNYNYTMLNLSVL